jgi:glycosyltransferase involved in cell wall biosynthesis
MDNMSDSLVTCHRVPKWKAANKEEVISNPEIAQLQVELKELKNQLAGVEIFLKNNSIRGLLRRFVARSLWMRLHLHRHHEPRDLFVSSRYRREIPIDKPPLMSLVTPSYNQARFLEQTIRSALDQNYPRLEYVVQDGGSKDGTSAILDRYRNTLHHVETRKDRGQGNAINLAFGRTACGEIMGILNSDDLLLPGSLNYVAAYFSRHPEIDVVYGHRVLIDSRGKEIGRWVLPNHSDRMLLWANYVPPETLFWRRRIWEKTGGRIDESLQFAFLWELLLRFRSAGAKFMRLPRFLGAFRVRDWQKTAHDLATIGEPEMAELRYRIHEREIGLSDVRSNMTGYMLRHAWHNFIYRIGLSRA